MSIWICPECKKMMHCILPGVCSVCGNSCFRVTDDNTSSPYGRMAYDIAKKLSEAILGTTIVPYRRLSVALYDTVHSMGLDDHVCLVDIECEHRPNQTTVSSVARLVLSFTEAPEEHRSILVVLTSKDIVLYVGLEPALTLDIKGE